MLKIISLVVLIAVIVQRSSAGPEEMAKLITDCKTAEKVTDADVANFKNKVKPVPKEVKCLQTCLAEKMGLISNNTINKDGAMKFAKALPNSNEKVVQSVSEIIEECSKVQDTERCEYGAKFIDCITEAGAKRGLKDMCM